MGNISILVTVAAVMFAVLGAITLLAYIYNLNDIKAKTVGDGQHGTARFLNKGEVRKICCHYFTCIGYFNIISNINLHYRKF